MFQGYDTTKVRKYKHLNIKKRAQLELLLRQKKSKSEIARTLGIARLTVYERGTVPQLDSEYREYSDTMRIQDNECTKNTELRAGTTRLRNFRNTRKNRYSKASSRQTRSVERREGENSFQPVESCHPKGVFPLSRYSFALLHLNCKFKVQKVRAHKRNPKHSGAFWRRGFPYERYQSSKAEGSFCEVHSAAQPHAQGERGHHLHGIRHPKPSEDYSQSTSNLAGWVNPKLCVNPIR